jgi:hypothetical protein
VGYVPADLQALAKEAMLLRAQSGRDGEVRSRVLIRWTSLLCAVATGGLRDTRPDMLG